MLLLPLVMMMTLLLPPAVGCLGSIGRDERTERAIAANRPVQMAWSDCDGGMGIAWFDSGARGGLCAHPVAVAPRYAPRQAASLAAAAKARRARPPKMAQAAIDFGLDLDGFIASKAQTRESRSPRT